jgi:hypothetical protein
MNSEKVNKAIKEVFEELEKMTKEEFKAMLDNHISNIPQCEPDTCQGQCQGFGGCYICDDFHKVFPTVKGDDNES